ncbi:MAG: M48 family metalloprotease [Acidobacteria bacterium]|nr:M48 family metalloprotease [Acidobacteriota bacterium]
MSSTQSVVHVGRGVGSGKCVSARHAMALVAIASLIFAPLAQADRTKLKPGWNLYSPAKDVELGKEASAEVEKQVLLLNDRKVDSYLTKIGMKLAAKAPGEKYPFQFKCVNDKVLNAFALPGGFMYINRGIIEAADNEAQLMGVMGHEMGHVVLRHGTNQASKASLTQGGLGVLGALLGGSTAGNVAALGTQLLATGVLLKYSRDAESQADLMGTQLLYDTGYDPRAMAQFFEKLNAESKGGRPPEFLSDHPNPVNRYEKTLAEVKRLGGPPQGYKSDSPEFKDIKRYVLSLPAPPKQVKGGAATPQAGSGGSAASGVAGPSDTFQTFKNDRFQIIYPDNWKTSQQGDGVALLPDGGVVRDSSGNDALAYGVIVNMFEPHKDRASQQIAVEDATDQFIEEMRHSNPKLKVTRQHESIRVGGSSGLSVYFTNDSPTGGHETDRLVTVMRPEGLLYFLCVAPENQFKDYDRAFSAMVDSIRFTRK